MRIKVTSREIFIPSPAAGIGVGASSYYTQPQGVEKLSYHQFISRSDTSDIAFLRRSEDNGQTWSEPQTLQTQEKSADGTLQRFRFHGYIDPPTGRLLNLRQEGVLPTGDPREGMKSWLMFYAVSEDGGRTALVDEQIIQDGPEYSAQHPLPDVWNGKNSIHLGSGTCVPLTLPDGTILVPCQSPPLGDDGELYNPCGGYTYTDSLVLRGRWREDKTIAWEASQRVTGDPSFSTRGVIEPTLALLKDGRILMVLRASNDSNHALPGHKWVSLSSDDGHTWSTPRAWTYDDGTPFFSPSSCSQLFRHSSGKLLWFGNITPQNPKGNGPRYPLLAGEVDQTTGLLRQETLTTIEDRGPDDGPALQLSNFNVYEDRISGEMLLHMSLLFAGGHNDHKNMTSDAMLYHLALEEF